MGRRSGRAAYLGTYAGPRRLMAVSSSQNDNTTRMYIPFHKPSFTDLEIGRIGAAAASGHLRAGGPYSRLCLKLLSNRFGESELLLTGSATAALEMAMILAGIGPGDEVIMPAFTFVACANSVV